MAELDLDARLDDLFAQEPTNFTATRDQLVRDLKTAGLTDDAADVRALRKPTVAVAAVNRIARTHADQVAALVDIGDELAALQADASADRDELRDLTRQRRTLLQQLTDQAAATTERPDGARSAIAATLDTASLDEHLRDDLLRGRITRELSPATRFVLGDDTPSPSRPKATRTERDASPPRDELAARRARVELEAAQARAEEAEESVREQTEAATDATERLDAAHRHIADVEAALSDARAELVDAKRAERDAQRAQARARAEHERVTAALHAAERAVDDSR